MADRLLLRAESTEDLQALSPLVQDMVVKCADIHWDPKARRLTLLGNRYRHESDPSAGPARIRALLRLDFIDRVQRREWPDTPHAVLPLLALAGEDQRIEMIFGGGTSLRLEAECIDITLEDLGGPWGALAVPDHGI